jgi:4-hydroxythreonine-4-phosphate dehydrogenase
MYSSVGPGQNAGMDLLVVADDRTGALETAATLADRLATPIAVSAWPDRRSAGAPHEVVVVDLGTRHLSPAEARDRVGDLSATGRAAHKLDSTLRGNWPDELAAWTDRRPVLLVPALPEQGRTCVGGVVLEHGRPVHEGGAGTDVRRRVTSSRPAELLRGAGVQVVDELAGLDQIAAWLVDPVGVAVGDAATADDIAAVVAAWWDGRDDVLLAGTSVVIGTAAPVRGAGVTPPAIDGPVLVVCGSVHPAARAQLEELERAGIPVVTIADGITADRLRDAGVLVLVTEIPVGDVDEPLAVAAASALAGGVADLRREVALGALVVIGGDTAAAVFGAAAVAVHGTVAPGTAWARVDGFDMPVITRSGGFGSDRSLVDLVRGTLRS